MTALCYVRSLVGAAALGLGAVALAGCQGLPGLGAPSIPVMPDLTPPAAVPPPQSALGIAPGAPPPGPPTIWSKLGLSQQQREFRRRQMCETPFGKLMGLSVAPASRLSGGLIPPFCPAMPSLQQLLDKGPIGAAAKVKADKLNAKKRKQAVDALKNVDCHYWPEAEEALVAALRTDRNEAVRYSAAKALSTGKCCTNKTIEALSICASGSDRDGAPCEVSATVRAAAAKALEHCLACQCLNRCGVQYCDGPEGAPAEEKPREEEPPRNPGEAVTPASAKPSPYPVGDEPEDVVQRERLKGYYGKVRKKPTEAVLATARDVLARVNFPPGADAIPAGNVDFAVVEMFPDPPLATSPRPEGVFDRPLPYARPAAPARRDPSRPANIFDMFTSPGSPPTTPTPSPAASPPQGQTTEPPRAPVAPIRPAVFTEPTSPGPTLTVEREPGR
jgi:hypothetical protein